MVSVNIHEAKARLSELVATVQDRNERILIYRDGLAVAEIVPFRRSKRSTIDEELRHVEIRDDLTQPTEAERA